VPSRTQLVNSLSLWRTVLDPKPVQVAFVVDRMALGEAFVRVLQFSPVTVYHQCSVHISHSSTNVNYKLTALLIKTQL